MSYCQKMKRPCNCGKLCIYRRDGTVQDSNAVLACFSDLEVRMVISMLSNEWQRRFAGAQMGAAPLLA